MDLKQKNLSIIIFFALIVAIAFFFELKPKLPSTEKEITFWQYWSGSEKEPLEALVHKFNKVHAEEFGFKVKLLTISMPQKKIMMAMAGDVAPDLVHLDGGMVVDFALRGALTDLSTVILSEAKDPMHKGIARTNPLDRHAALAMTTNRFIPIYVEALKIQGVQYALPLMPTCEAMHVNKTLLDKLGIETPRSLADIAKLHSRFKNPSATRLAKRGGDGVDSAVNESSPSEYNAVDGDFGNGYMPSWPPWVGRFLPIVFGGNWGKQLEDGSWQVTANSPENIEAWTWVQENFASKFKPGELASFTEGFSSYQSPDNPFYAGKVAVENSGVWEKNLAKIYNPEMEVTIAPFPGKVENATLISVDALAIPKMAKNKKEAAEFMQWLLKQENVENLALAQAKFSPLKDVTESFYLEHSNPYIKVFIDLANSPNAKFFPQLSFIKRYQRDIKEAYDKVLRMELNAKEALDQLQEKLYD